jgi:IS30 family transposase
MSKPKRKSPPLSLSEWILICRMRYENKEFREIAKKLNRPLITVKRAINRFIIPPYLSYRDWEKYGYYCWEQSNDKRAQSRKRGYKLDNIFLRSYVTSKLEDQWSPQNIVCRLKIDHPKYSLCAETIYEWIYNHPDGEKYIEYLVRGAREKRQGKPGSRRLKGRQKKISEKKSIETRPVSADDRTSDGALESDLIIGKGRSCLLVIVNRKTRRVWIRKLKSKESLVIYWALLGILRTIPEEERLTLTTDNGTEFAKWQEVEHLIGIWIYFCHPYCSFEKGTVENRNGVIRNRFFKKGTDFDDVSNQEIRDAETWINNYPMLIHDGLTPLEAEAKFRKEREENKIEKLKLAA